MNLDDRSDPPVSALASRTTVAAFVSGVLLFLVVPFRFRLGIDVGPFLVKVLYGGSLVMLLISALAVYVQLASEDLGSSRKAILGTVAVLATVTLVSEALLLGIAASM